VIQQEAENVAYTSKGLFKTADWLKIRYKICVFASFSIGLILLGLNIPIILSKVLGIVSIMIGITLLLGEKEFKKNEQYYKLANKYLGIYKDLQEMYYKGENSEKLYNLREQIKKLDKETSNCPISKVGRWWSRKVIRGEMNLNWIYEAKNK